MPCATVDEESGSNLKLGSCMDQPLVLLGTRKLVLKMFLSNEPLHKILLSANQTLALSLIYPVHYILFIPPPWVWLDLLSTSVLTPFLILQRKTPTSFQKTLSRVPSCTQPCLWIGITRRRYRMAQDSDDFLFIFNIVACVWIVILAIVVLLCSLPRRVVR